MPRRIGLIVNPIAGMGGAAGLKGTDGRITLAEAVRRGATAQSGLRAVRALIELTAARDAVTLFTPAGAMGADAAAAAGLVPEIIQAVAPHPSAVDTGMAAAILRDLKVDLVVFSGGDGTARDIHQVLQGALPMLGIPSGVKMQSGVFATSPAAAGRLLARLCGGASLAPVQFRQAEIMDIDEDALRRGQLSARLYGYAPVPDEPRHLQQAKSRAPQDDEPAVAAAAQGIAREMQPGVAYVIGPGRSAKQVLAALGHAGTLLGVDVVRDGALIGADLTAADLRALCATGPVRIVTGVIGGQGFVFGRGNQQIAAEVIGRAGRAGLSIIAGRQKLAAIPGARLLADTGDAAVDAALCGHVRVRCGAGEWAVMQLVEA